MKPLSCTDVIDQIERATKYIRRLPPVKPAEHFCNWPEILRSFYECYGNESANDRLNKPMPLNSRQVSELDQVIEWLTWVTALQSKVVWSAAEGISWRKIAAIAGKSDKTCKQLAEDAIVEITMIQNGLWEKPHERRQKRRFVKTVSVGVLVDEWA